jgi:dephospho-CoA kinase
MINILNIVSSILFLKMRCLDMPLIIGITGSIASGKGAVCETLKKFGAIHGDADKIVHALYEPGKPAYYRIIKAFGNEIIQPDEFIDRKKLGTKVFGKPEAMKLLTSSIGNISEAIHNTILNWRNTLPENGIGVMEAVNLIEAGYSQWTDVTWLVACDEKNALPRLMKRNNFSEGEALQRISSQKTWQERESASDLLIMNNESITKLTRKVTEEFNSLYECYKNKNIEPSRYIEWQKNNSD